MDGFDHHGVIDFLRSGYDVLHTQGREYILSEIDVFLKNRGWRYEAFRVGCLGQGPGDFAIENLYAVGSVSLSHAEIVGAFEVRLNGGVMGMDETQWSMPEMTQKNFRVLLPGKIARTVMILSFPPRNHGMILKSPSSFTTCRSMPSLSANPPNIGG